VSLVELGRGRLRILFAPGGQGENLEARMRYALGVKGTMIGFVYEESGHFGGVAHIRRQADRDAAEVRALATEHRTTQAIGFSRGARAIVGSLAEGEGLFRRIALVIPPAKLRVTQNYETWLASLSTAGRREIAAEILVVGETADRGHPTEEAHAWAKQLGARLEVLPSRTVATDPGRIASVLAAFFN
jgi:hypothetical protein